MCFFYITVKKGTFTVPTLYSTISKSILLNALFASATLILTLSPILYILFECSPIASLLSSLYIKYSSPNVSYLINPSIVFSNSTKIPKFVIEEMIPSYSSPILF